MQTVRRTAQQKGNMQKITVVIRVDAGAVVITPEIVESALNTYLAENGNVTVFQAAQHSVHLTVLPVREIETVCPHCSLVFDVPVPEPHSK